MLSFIKSYFSSTPLGTLYRDNKIYRKETRISLTTAQPPYIQLDNKYEEEKIFISDISDINIIDNTLTFCYNRHKYKYITQQEYKDKLNKIYINIIKYNIKDKEYKSIIDDKIDDKIINYKENDDISLNESEIEEIEENKSEESEESEIEEWKDAEEDIKERDKDDDKNKEEDNNNIKDKEEDIKDKEDNIKDIKDNTIIKDIKEEDNINNININNTININNINIIYKGENIIFSIYNIEENKFTEGIEVNIEILKDIDYYLLLYINDRDIIYKEKITSIYYVNKEITSFTWSIKKEEGYNSFTLILKEKYKEFIDIYFKCLVEDEEYKEMDVSLIGYIESEYTESEEVNNNSTYSLDRQKKSEYTESEEVNNNSTYSLDRQKIKSSEEQNRNMCMGEERIYVSKANTLGIYDRNLICKGSINTGGDIDRLVEGMGSIYISDGEKIKMVDIERGSIISEWKENVNDLLSGGVGVIGVKEQGLIRVDKRVREVVKGRMYKTPVGLLYGSSGGEGVAVVSRKGDLRLYSDICGNARVLIPGYGDECRGVDVSKDGRYVIRTYDYYIVLDDNGGGVYSKVRKSGIISVRLSLLAEHMSLGVLSCGTFSSDSNDILSSIGNYILVWRMKDIMHGRIEYEITRNNAQIVQDRFISGSSKEIIITTHNDIKKIYKK